MTDVNTPLNIAYFDALKSLPIPVFEGQLPDNSNPEEYIVFRSINSNDASTNNSSDTRTSITVEIHTVKNKINQAAGGNSIAAQVYARILPYPQFSLPLQGMQMVSTKVASDRSDNFDMNRQLSYLSRYITFEHHIFINTTP